MGRCAMKFIIRGLRITATAEAAVKAKLPPKYMYVLLILCFTKSGHVLKEDKLRQHSVKSNTNCRRHVARLPSL